jgi:hypothetical protein
MMRLTHCPAMGCTIVQWWACALLGKASTSDIHDEEGMRNLLAGSLLLGLVAGAVSPARGQDEAHLRQALEGQRITLKIDMPASTEGIDVYPGTTRPVDFQKYGGRLKKYGAAIQSGTSALITKIKVRGDHIEVQLDGGGYGSFGDALESFGNSTGTDSGTAHQAKMANDRTTRLAAGSRFNIQYPNDVTPDAMTVESVVQALQQYASFSAEVVASTVAATTLARAMPTAARSTEVATGMSTAEVERIAGKPVASTPRDKLLSNRYTSPDGEIQVDFYNDIAVSVKPVVEQPSGALHKGMSKSDVEAIAGAAVSSKVTDQVTTNTYDWHDGTLEADFFNGVLVGYRISSR